MYLLILVVISLFFSINLYRISTYEINTRLRRQTDFIRRSPDRGGPNLDILPFEQERQNELTDSRQHILWQLIYANLTIVLFGGLGSYWLAQRTLRPIEEAHAAQTRFTADASHELRTPIAAMQAETEVALRNPKLSADDARELLASNLEELAKLTRLSEGLLQLARGDADSRMHEQIDATLMVKECLDAVQQRAESKQIILKADPIPAAIVLGNRGQLTQLLVLLVDNAIKYSPKKSLVKITVAVDHDKLKLCVVDHGYGISQSNLAHIFDRFYRVDSSRSKASAGGYGLGLSIAKQIADAHEGTLSVTSTLHKGSTFCIVLPLYQKS